MKVSEISKEKENNHEKSAYRSDAETHYFYPPFMHAIVSLAQRSSWVVGKALFSFFLHFRVYGRENLKGLPKGVIFASNHISDGDGILISGSLNFFSKKLPLYFVARERKFYADSLTGTLIYTRPLLRSFGAYPAIVGIHDYEKSLAFHVSLLKKGRSVGVFPEGTRSLDGRVLPAKGGVVALAKFTNAPIIPVAVRGISRITLKEFLLRKRFVSVTFGKPIYPQELFAGHENAEAHEYKAIADEKVMAKIIELLEK